MRLERGQVAVVTGAGSGIGAALVRAFRSRGLDVAALDVEGDALGELASTPSETAATAETQGALMTASLDVRDAEAFGAVRDAVLTRFGRVDVVCNNAGVIGPRVPTWEQRPEDWRWILDVNLIGVIHGLDAFLPTLVQAGRGHVVNTASISGLAPVDGGGNAPYAAAKYAVVGISETLHQELTRAGSQVGVTVVCPGPVTTRILDAERNRPSDLRVADRAPDTPVFERRTTALGPDDVAAQVLDAIERDQLFLVPMPGPVAVVAERTQRLHGDLRILGLPG